MSTYYVNFAQWYSYEVEADNSDEAIKLAQDEFLEDVRCPVCRTEYDEVQVEDENGKEVAHY
jgi:hypothetical protein